jgi:hypothetical protein
VKETPPATVLPIERKHDLTPSVFAREHLHGTGKPVVVTDATERWPARSKWTFDFMKSAYGSDLVCPELGLHSGIGRLTKLATYLDFIDNPTTDLDGFWVDVATKRPLPQAPEAPDVPPYLVSWLAFQRHPELFHDIEPAPGFVDDWVLALNPPLRDRFETIACRGYWDVLIGPKGSHSNFHQDYRHTHAYLAQIQGRKRVMLLAPDDYPRLTGGRAEGIAPDDLRELRPAGPAVAYEGVLNPGDLLFIPADWWHWVDGLEKSITVSHNFFNGANFSAHLESMVGRLQHGHED